jgi:predicted patatin/cPLA2 family phospholipase
MRSIGLVLEGGGMKGVYTAGVLEFMMSRQLYIPYVIGVSAGACQAASYISRQPGRNKRVSIDLVKDPRYLSYRNWFRERSLFGMRFIFDEVPNRLVPFDYAAFEKSDQNLVVVTTDAVTGKAVYYSKEDTADARSMLQVIQASSSLPFVSKPVTIGGRVLFDGGIADPLPIRQAIADGNRRNIVVLTKDEEYTIKPFTRERLLRIAYGRYPGLMQTMLDRHRIYNESMKRILELEASGEVFLIRPSQPVQVSRLEKNTDRLNELYELGYRDAATKFAALEEWLKQAI